jgi:poly(ADP-ribose) glycohydrolase ARH3
VTAATVNLQSKFLGGMLGCALGDAIGELAFLHGEEADLRHKVSHTRTLVYTDDTAMAIGLAESITQVGRLDQQHLGDTFRANFQREPWRGYASGPPNIFRLVERQKISYSQAARSLFGGQGSFGNGASMRVAPVGLLFHAAPGLYAQVSASASVTHAHPVGIDGAAVLALAIAQATRLDPQQPFPLDDFVQELVNFAQTEQMRAKMRLVQALLAEDVSPLVAAMRLRHSVAAHESVPFAIYAFLRHPRSFEDCLFCAALYSADRDTVGAMACAIAGAHLGVGAIPSTWLAKIENRQYIEELALKLCALLPPL